MSRDKGKFYEDKAVDFLKLNGFELIERNFYSRFGELDIIAKKEGVLHFIEVKGGQNFEPIYAITPSKILKILKTIDFYLYKNNLNIPYCIDAVIIFKDDIRLEENLIF